MLVVDATSPPCLCTANDPCGRRAKDNHFAANLTLLGNYWYNYVKQHKSLKGLSPAMAAGLSDALWSMTDLAEMIDSSLPKPGKRGQYKKQLSA
jgi:hypothetical protein